MFTLLINARVYAPQPLGLQCVLTCAGTIVYIGDQPPVLDPALAVETVDMQGLLLLPGLIDGHTHITGGGGESRRRLSVRFAPGKLFIVSDRTAACPEKNQDEHLSHDDRLLAPPRHPAPGRA